MHCAFVSSVRYLNIWCVTLYHQQDSTKRAVSGCYALDVCNSVVTLYHQQVQGLLVYIVTLQMLVLSHSTKGIIVQHKKSCFNTGPEDIPIVTYVH